MNAHARALATEEMRQELVIDPRYQGFPGVALGGYVGGLLAGGLGGPVEVSFEAPPPVGEPLRIGRPAPGGIVLGANGSVVAEARRAEPEIEVPSAVSLGEAEHASAGYPGLHAHPFPGCFACGPEREHGDGLRIFPGRVAAADLVAAPWTPDVALADSEGTVLPRFVWAALDCPQLWALITSAPAASNERVVTGAMTVRIDSPLRAGTQYVVIAWPMHNDGRAIFAGGAIFSEQGELMVASVQRAVVVSGMGVPLGFGKAAA